MRTLVFDTHSYDRVFLDAANAGRHVLEYTTAQLDAQTAALARGCDAVCLFVNDHADAATMAVLAAGGVRAIVQRSTGYNNLDLTAAARLGIACYRVRDYSAHSAPNSPWRCSRP
jgi:D-lactate dehydrogenase